MREKQTEGERESREKRERKDREERERHEGRKREEKALHLTLHHWKRGREGSRSSLCVLVWILSSLLSSHSGVLNKSCPILSQHISCPQEFSASTSIRSVDTREENQPGLESRTSEREREREE